MEFKGKNVTDSLALAIVEALDKSSSYKEVLLSLGMDWSKRSRDNLSNWCAKNYVDTSRLHSSSPLQKSGHSFIKKSDEELLTIARCSPSVSAVCRKLDIPPLGYYHKAVVSKLVQLGFDFSEMRKNKGHWQAKKTRIPDEEFFVEGNLKKGSVIKRRMLLTGVLDQCSDCKLGTMWNGKKITLTVDHIDGNPLNNKKENLRILCPNCHSQTSTFCGRGISVGRTVTPGRHTIQKRQHRAQPPERVEKVEVQSTKKVKIAHMCINCSKKEVSGRGKQCRECFCIGQRKVIRPSKETLLELLTGEISFLALGRQLGVSDQAVRKWCRQLGLDTKKMGRAAKTAKRRQTIPTARHSTKESNMQEVPYVVCPLPDPQVVTLEVGAEMPN